MDKQNIMLELDPIFEILGLLFKVNNLQEQHKDNLIKELDKFIFNGEEFYNKHLKYQEKYINSFNSHKITHKLERFFFEQDEYLFILFTATLGMNKQWLQGALHGNEPVSEHEIRLQLINALIEEQSNNDVFLPPVEENKLDQLSYIMTFLNQSNLSEAAKWKLIVILESPKYYISELVQLILDNVPAFEQAKQAIDKTLQKLLKNYQKLIINGKIGTLDFANPIAETKVVFPTLIMPLALIGICDLGYCGLQIFLLPAFKKNVEQTNDLLLSRLKALADHSKLQIMQSLKAHPKYNLEIAEQLGLTAATMSHHMNVLLACRLVEIEKKHGKVYYSVDTQSVSQFVKELETFLL